MSIKEIVISKNLLLRNMEVSNEEQKLSEKEKVTRKEEGRCRFRRDEDCSKCPQGVKGADKNSWVGFCVMYIGEDDCKAC